MLRSMVCRGFWKPWRVCMPLFETWVRLHACFWKPWKPWHVSMSLFETLKRLHAFFGNPGTFACLVLKPWYVCARDFGNPGTLACPFLKPWHVCTLFVERLARLLSLFETLVRLHARFWKLWYVSMSHFETLVRLHAFFGNPAAFACPLLKPWYVCLPF